MQQTSTEAYHHLTAQLKVGLENVYVIIIQISFFFQKN